MIGNDIVDLTVAAKESNWQRKGYLEKVFTAYEQKCIRNAADAHKMVWRLWSIKESAYKVHVQQYGKRFFAPKKMSCELTSATSALVTCNDSQYTVATQEKGEAIFSTAIFLGDKTKASHFCFVTGMLTAKAQSNKIHHELKKRLSQDAQLSYEGLHIAKTNAGVPVLFYKNRRLSIPFSITHHGRFAAISILKAS